MRTKAVLLALALCLPLAAAAQRPTEAHRPIPGVEATASKPKSKPKPAPPPQHPSDVVDAFHHALRAGERGKTLEFLASDVLVFEQGRLERSRAEYAKSHLQEDMGFAAVTQRTVTRRSVKLQGSVAWVLSVNRVRGKFNDQPVDMTTDETMILQKSAGRWRIVHIHWSFNQRAAPP